MTNAIALTLAVREKPGFDMDTSCTSTHAWHLELLDSDLQDFE